MPAEHMVHLGLEPAMAFGVPRRRIATIEEPVEKSDGHSGFIDRLWKGILLVEHKSRGKDLECAVQQAKDYFPEKTTVGSLSYEPGVIAAGRGYRRGLSLRRGAPTTRGPAPEAPARPARDGR